MSEHEYHEGHSTISISRSRFDVATVHGLLKQSHWAPRPATLKYASVVIDAEKSVTAPKVFKYLRVWPTPLAEVQGAVSHLIVNLGASMSIWPAVA